MDPLNSSSAPLHRAFEGPAQVVAVVGRMLLGLGLAVTLVLKVYMGVFTDLVCTADTVTLGNTIRCTPTLELVARVLMFVAGLEVAALLFSDRPHRLGAALLLGVVAVLLQVLAGLTSADSLWQTALILAALLVLLAGVFLALRLPERERPRAEPPTRQPEL
ncbi:hypothetical protein [Frigidibacter sp. ROC022]|uniref:hypothetical protein n=1 Tax=Frigidibacter sp. ROC022 TaxID=2971796 RepID=UPI00215A7460|nr:hypothetical protein [Frigidibacter sp. ROC022]MCR8725746.1 hypothetical protein [Frigidibacter sp. ROC022]